ncbi:spore coat U domain-containing protein [Halomonas huangheensis]|uniref:Spore coat protein U/FanG domain-containing protein n=1 Tax=Halomonas huangheensis TaxID=1178482 RepID=W1N113_9GAMM|nr:spore coat U domain-containing protein [Halomonas huangheensis]ALM52420.1 hypothetical protein AR456_09105 [Halomonas huangheensis]ERL49173.1 hypothetical protein BJB45_07820 [Halomonas huangheensis]
MLRLILILLTLIFLQPLSAVAQVLNNCSFSVTNVNFGTVNTLAGGVVDTTGTVNVTCNSTLGATFRVCLNLNAGVGGATSGIRHMTGPGGSRLDYRLYKDAARATPWGSRTLTTLGTPVALQLSVPILGSVSTTRTIYARVAGNQQAAPPGTYTSTFSGGQVEFNWRASGTTDCNALTRNPTRPSFNVQAIVAPNCNVTAQDINFGDHGVLDTEVSATGAISVNCTSGTTYNIGLNNGLNGDGPTQRRMSLGDQAITYGLYRDAAHSQPWGNTIGSDTVSGAGVGGEQNLSVYGRVPAQMTPSPGTYSDTVVVTVTY